MDKEPDLIEQPPEVIRQHIEETRSALTEKLQTLEQGVKETVQEAKSAVVETAQTVKETVAGTVETVRDTVHGTVTSVKQTFDLKYQVNEHPWMMLGGSVALGFITGRLVRSEDDVIRGMSHAAQPSPEPYQTREPETLVSSRSQDSRTDFNPGRKTGFLGELATKFAPEIDKVKGLAIGAVLGLLRDMVKPSIPENLVPQVEDVFERVTTKLGGEPVRGPVIDTASRPTSQLP
jgi:ElaB/YqjD/DUF883 family membrane-anchored ribosome-binding protein